MKKLFLFSAVAFLLLLGYSVAYATSHFVYPVPGLGNCENREACSAYCDEPENGPSCLEYGIKMGTIDAETAQKLKESLPKGGPGGCHTDKLCRSYCSDVAHAEECTRYGEEHNLISPQETKQAKEFINITGPGGCRGANECRAYCESSEHKDECLQFGQRKGLISEQRVQVAKELAERGGPGGCRSSEECKIYCGDPAHIEACLSFGERHGFVAPEQAQLIKKSGLIAGPGGCTGDQCRAYCGDPAHQEECVAFALEKGLMSQEEAERVRKLAGKPGPGGCRGDACKAYCEDQSHAEECLRFAEENGFLPKEEIERARKFVRISQEGGPGGCRGSACRSYCDDPARQDECFEFAKKQGIIRPEEERQFETGKKIREKMQATGGPGGCRSEEECRTYCTDPAHVEECIAFGSTHGGIPEEEVREMLKQFQQNRFGKEAQFENEFLRPEETFRFQEETERRFQEFRQLEEQFRSGFGSGQPFSSAGEFEGKPFDSTAGGFPGEALGGPGFVGPGGCASPSECIKYCSEHKEECFSFGPPGQPGSRPPEGGIPPGREPFPGRGQRPQLRGNLIQEIRPDDLPPDFEGKSEEERREIFRQKFDEFHGRPEDLPAGRQDFPGRFDPNFPRLPEQIRGGQGGFPGRPGDIPEGRQNFPPRSGEFPREGFRPDSQTFPNSQNFPGTVPPFRGMPSPGDLGIPREEFARPPEGMREPTRVDQLFQQQPSETAPPPGSFSNPPPSTGTFAPAEGFVQPPPFSGEINTPPPPSSEPAPQPSGVAPLSNFFGAILKAFSRRY